MTEHAELSPAALKLPRVGSVNPCRPPVLVLEDLTVIRLADLPAPMWVPETIFGVAVVVSDWRDPTAPAWLLPDALVPAFREALDQLDAPEPLRPLLVGLSFTDAEVRFTVQQGRGLDLVATLPVLVGRLVEVGQEVHVDILDLDRRPLYGFSIDRSTPAGSDLLTRLCTELVQPQP